MAILVPKDATSSDSAASPVGWYLLVWIMLSLASNSMAQPSGRICGASTRYRVYLCSSPLFCFADGLAILARVAVTCIHLRISPLKASRLAIMSRADERHHTKRNGGTSFDDQISVVEPGGPPKSSTAAWPRWLFFLVGTVPAAIQLASFSGVPRTQLLGLLYVSSFAVIEIVSFLSTFEEECSTIPEVLDYMKVEGVSIEQQDLRFKVYKLMVRLEWYETSLFTITIIAQCVMMFELFQQLWIPVMTPFHRLFKYNLMKWVSAILGTCMLVLQFTDLLRGLSWLLGWQSFIRWYPRGLAYWTWILSMVFLVLLPYKDRSGCPDCSATTNYTLMDRAPAVAFIFLLFYYSNSGMIWLCERWPQVAKALLIERRGWELEKIEHITDYYKTGFEKETGVIQSQAWMCFCMFMTHLLVCVLWYAFIYDSTGTVNPSWTYVFG